MREGRGGGAHLAARTVALGGLVAAETSPESKGIAGAEAEGGRLDPLPAVLPGLRSWTGVRKSTTAELVDRSARRGEVGSRGCDGEQRRRRSG